MDVASLLQDAPSHDRARRQKQHHQSQHPPQIQQQNEQAVGRSFQVVQEYIHPSVAHAPPSVVHAPPSTRVVTPSNQTPSYYHTHPDPQRLPIQPPPDYVDVNTAYGPIRMKKEHLSTQQYPHNYIQNYEQEQPFFRHQQPFRRPVDADRDVSIREEARRNSMGTPVRDNPSETTSSLIYIILGKQNSCSKTLVTPTSHSNTTTLASATKNALSKIGPCSHGNFCLSFSSLSHTARDSPV